MKAEINFYKLSVNTVAIFEDLNVAEDLRSAYLQKSVIYSDTEAETDLNKLKATAVDLFIDLDVILKLYTCSYTAIDLQLTKEPSKNNNCAGSPLAANNKKRVLYPLPFNRRS